MQRRLATRSVVAKRAGNSATTERTVRQVATVGVDDALRILVLMAERRDERYERAAARWAARVASERSLSLGDSRRVLALVNVLPEAPGAVKSRLLRHLR